VPENEQAGLIAGLDHPGFVVRDLDAAVAFFTEVLGAGFVREGSASDVSGTMMNDVFGVDPRAESRFAFVAFGDRQVEFLEWRAPDQETRSPSNSDIGGRHLALRTNDLNAMIERVSQVPGVTVRRPAHNGFVYVATPFGLEVQLLP
jgi:catechol 2,3-dioxygenase-like lactoylglutathione lyase family enzyme